MMNDTIIAQATAQGFAAIAVIRLSGPEAISITASCFQGANLLVAKTHTAHVGLLSEGETAIDEVLVTLFRNPKSFTREDVVEIGCHGSPVVVQKIITLFLSRGVRLATPGEFTRRAFLNGRFTLAQAEAVADLIHAENDNARQAALNQMRGGFSSDLQRLREELLNFASLIELELDFGEEDVEFAERDDLKRLIVKIRTYINPLIQSFVYGNVVKNGIPTVIAGKPNAGKSTLLNALLREEKAIVSEIPGTTRDVIEDVFILGGITFRLTDTAGLRQTTDVVESIGVERTRARMAKASLILYVYDLSVATLSEIAAQEEELQRSGIPYLNIGNKVDIADPAMVTVLESRNFIFISAKLGTHLEVLKAALIEKFEIREIQSGDVMVTNLRHYEKLVATDESLSRVLDGMAAGVTGDFLAMDIRQALQALGEITGAITSDEILGAIFSKFCIGK